MFIFAIGDSQRNAEGERPGPPRAGSAPNESSALLDGEVLRAFDLQRDDWERLISLKEVVYDRPVNRAAFEWQYFGHPRAREMRVFVVEQEGKLVASTTRMPATIRLAGADRPAFFNIDSMVHPGHRRRGRMRDLYELARRQIGSEPLFFSKGSSAQIYPLLMSIGHREIVPNTQLVSYPSATRWIMSRLRLRTPSQPPHRPVPVGFDEYRPIERFGRDFDVYFERVAKKLPSLFTRDAAFMNWRYLDIPHRKYLAYERVIGGEVVGMVVLSVTGEHGQIVDVLWDPDRESEPERSVRFAQALFDEHEVVRIACFATHPRLREVLSRSGFLDRGETPRFSVFAPTGLESAFTPGAQLHVVDGDGDTEFS